MDKFTFDIKNIAEGHGIGISITGMLIVFVALTLIAVFISVLPYVLRKLEPYLPTVDDLHAVADKESGPALNEQMIAAIGYALFKKRSTGSKKT